MTAITDATISSTAQNDIIPSRDVSMEPGGEDFDAILAISRKLDALKKEPSIGTVSPVAAFNDQAVDLLGKIEHNTSLLIKRNLPAVRSQTRGKSVTPATVLAYGSPEKPGKEPSAEVPKTSSDVQTAKAKAPRSAKGTVSPDFKSHSVKRDQSKSATETVPPSTSKKPSVKKAETSKLLKDPQKPAKDSSTVAPLEPQRMQPQEEQAIGPSKQDHDSDGGIRSQEARREQRDKAAQAELRDGLTTTIRHSLSNLGSAAYGKAKEIAKGETAQDIIGTAIGGPFYGAAKELKEAAQDILNVNPDSRTGRVVSKIKGKITGSESAATDGRRDKHGRFIPTKGAVSAKTTTDKQVVADIKNIRTDIQRSFRSEDSIASDTDKSRSEQLETTESISEKTTKTHRILKDNEERERKRHRKLIRTILLASLRSSVFGGPGSPGGRMPTPTPGGKKPSGKGGGKKGGDVDVDMEKGGKTVKPGQKPAKTPKPVAKPGILGKLGKLGKLGAIAGGVLGLGGLGLGWLFGDKGTPEIDDDLPDAKSKSVKSPKTTKTPAIAEHLSVGEFHPAPAKAMEEVSEGAGKKGAAKLGGKAALKMGGKAASLGLRVLGPAAALAFAGYDAISGWNDLGMQQQAFGLQEGQEATTGQKTSTAIANVLDMGGLGTGLLSLLGGDVGTGDIAKKLHNAASWLSDAAKAEKNDRTTGQKIAGVIMNPAGTIWSGVKGFFGGGEKTVKQPKDANEQAVTDTTTTPTSLGSLTAMHESGNNAGRVSSGVGDAGGTSYGTYQLSSNAGTLQNFMNTTKWGKEFEGLQVNSPAFKERWKELGKLPEFAVSQHEFMKKTHYDPMAKEAQKLGVDTSNRSIQEALWSIGTQHGASGGPNLLKKALASKDVASMDRKDILNAMYDERSREGAGGKLAYFQNSASDWQPGLRNRFKNERETLLAMETTGREETITKKEAIKIADGQPAEKSAKVSTAEPQQPMLVSQAITSPLSDASVTEIAAPAFPKKQQTIETLQPTELQKPMGGDNGGMLFGSGTAGSQGKYNQNIVSLLEDIARQTKSNLQPEGRFKKPDSTIPGEYDDTILTLMAHDRI